MSTAEEMEAGRKRSEYFANLGTSRPHPKPNPTGEGSVAPQRAKRRLDQRYPVWADREYGRAGRRRYWPDGKRLADREYWREGRRRYRADGKHWADRA